MGLFYNTMIEEIMTQFRESHDRDLESFIRERESFFKNEYQMDGLLFYLNMVELMNRQGLKSAYFDSELKKFQDNDF